ncbi:MAG: FtsX-like permease family protein, partial [Streptosporangiaceae bacterium]
MFTLALAVATGILFGLAPALQIARTDLNAVLQQDSGRTASSRSRHRFRSLLIVAEIALALPLLLGAAVLLASLGKIRNTDGGFNPAHLLTAQLALAPDRYSTTAAVAHLADSLLPRLRALPGVQSAALTLVLPLGLCPDFPMTVSGRAPDPNNLPDAEWHPSTSQAFEAMGIPILRGRGFLDSDTQTSEPVAVINQAAAARWWPHAHPVGQTVWIGKPVMGPALTDVAPRTIVGVVGTVLQNGLDSPPPPAVYVPMAQMGDGFTKLLVHLIPMALMVRTTGAPDALRGPVQAAVWSQDPSQPVSDLLSMQAVEARVLGPQRFNLELLGVFALLALLLAAIGIYGVMSYAVAERTREIGLRLAIGAAPGQLLRMVLGEALRMAAVGIALGLLAGWALLRLLAHQLSSLQGAEPAQFGAAAAALLLIALAACLAPALRAARLDPLVALRQD